MCRTKTGVEHWHGAGDGNGRPGAQWRHRWRIADRFKIWVARNTDVEGSIGSRGW
jgi:hypothetical protein